MKLNAKVTYFMLLGVVVLGVAVLLGAAYATDRFLSGEASKVRTAMVKNLSLEKQKTDLQRAKKDIEKYSNLAEIAAAVVPQDKDLAPTVREITNIAAANGVTLSGISFPTSTLGGKAGAADGQLKPVSGMEGTYTLDINLQSADAVRYSDFISFLQALEHNRRTALVSKINVSPAADDPNNVSFTLTIQEYIKP